MPDLTPSVDASLTTAQRAGTEELRLAIATTRRRLLDVLYARAQALTGVTGWIGPHRERFDAESHALLAAGRDLDDSLAGLLYALDDELDALRGTRPSTLGEPAVATILEEEEVGSPETVDDDGELLTGSEHDGIERAIRNAPIIPIRPDMQHT